MQWFSRHLWGGGGGGGPQKKKGGGPRENFKISHKKETIGDNTNFF